jgi:Fe2+ transport system protein FeoA
MTLADLKPGQTASIGAIHVSDPGVINLMVLGLVEGAEVKYKSKAIGGDPIEVSVYGASMSIRCEQAVHFSLEGFPALE